MSTIVEFDKAKQLRFEAPPGWLVIRTDPGLWQRDVGDLMAALRRNTRLPASDRRDVRDAIDAMVSQAQQVGTIAIMLMAAHNEPVDQAVASLLSATLTLTLVDAGDHEADLAASQLALTPTSPSASQLEEFSADLGPGLVRWTVTPAEQGLQIIAHDAWISSAEAHLAITASSITAIAHCTITSGAEPTLAKDLAVRLLRTLSPSTEPVVS